MNISKAELEGLFVDELARLQPTARYMNVLCEAVLNAWNQRKEQIAARVASVEQRTRAVRQRLQRLEEAFLFERTIDRETYQRQHETLREELKEAEMSRHISVLEEFDADGILAFAESVLPNASDIWVQATHQQRLRLQQLFFPAGVAFDGKRFSRTAVSTPAFNWLEAVQTPETSLVDQAGIEPATS